MEKTTGFFIYRQYLFDYRFVQVSLLRLILFLQTRMQSLSHTTNSISGVLREMIKQEGLFR